MNAEGLLIVRTSALGAETQIARIVRLVASAQGAKAPIQQQVDKVAAVFVPAVLVIALLTLLAWLWQGTEWPTALIHAVSVRYVPPGAPQALRAQARWRRVAATAPCP